MTVATSMGTDRPWYRFYDRGVPRTLQVPSHSIAEFLEHSARTYPRHAALIQVGPGFQRRLTYAELDRATDRFAQFLMQKGLRPGDRVALMLPNCPQYVIAAYGIWKAGGVLVQVNPLYRGRDLTLTMSNSGATMAVVLSRVYPQLAKAREETGLRTIVVTNVHDFFPLKWRVLYAVAKARKAGDVVPRDPGVVHFMRALLAPRARTRPKVSPDEPAVLQYTGGTTGVPKAATLTHRNLVANTLQARAWLSDLHEGEERILSVVPFFHVFGMTACVNLTVAISGTNIMMLTAKPFDAHMTAEVIATVRPTIFPGVPAIYLALNQLDNIERYNLKSIRICVSGSAPLPAEVQRRFEELTGGRIGEGFGLSEASPLTHVNPILGTRKAGSIGIPVPSTDARIVDSETGTKVLGPNEVGELAVRGPQIMTGYWNNPTETAQVLRDGWLYTGDIARMDEDGFFFIEDRKKDMVIIGGFKVFPREVEEVLYEHPRVREAAVVGVTHKIRGQMLVAHVVPKDPADGRALQRELKEFCEQRLSAYKVPRRFEVVEEIPKTLVGKPLRRDIRAREEERPEPNA